MSKITKIVIWLVGALIVAYAILAFDIPFNKTIDDFETCAAAGNPIMESFPRQCKDKKGNTYVEKISEGVPTADKIIAYAPQPGAVVSSPVRITGRARGTWYFEATFPIEIVGADGTILGSGHAEAKSDWMTTDFVPFESSISFNRGINLTGVIRLKKDNPSGDSARDENIDIPVKFGGANPPPSVSVKNCKPAGCSGEICSDQDVMSTCIYRSEFVCYKKAICARLSNGQCGWMQTAELASCISANAGAGTSGNVQ